MSQEVLLDVRTMPARERHPAIFDAWERLPVGGAIRLVNDHDPKPLFYEFQAERKGEFEWTPVERGPEKWVVAIRRVGEGSGRAPGATAVVAGRPSWAEREPASVVDVREDLRAGGEPFEKIMAAALQAQAGDVFMVRAIFEPQPLYKVLGSRGFEAWPERVAEDDWKVYFHKKVGGDCACGGRGHD